MLPDSILFSNAWFELQFWGCDVASNNFFTGSADFFKKFGAQIDVTDVWRTLENFGSELVKIWQNLTKFDKVARKFLDSSFPQYNLDGPKFCQILSNFFEYLSNFYISLSNFFNVWWMSNYLVTLLLNPSSGANEVHSASGIQKQRY